MGISLVVASLTRVDCLGLSLLNQRWDLSGGGLFNSSRLFGLQSTKPEVGSLWWWPLTRVDCLGFSLLNQRWDLSGGGLFNLSRLFGCQSTKSEMGDLSTGGLFKGRLFGHQSTQKMSRNAKMSKNRKNYKKCDNVKNV